MRVLKLDKTGMPEGWISKEEAACIYAKELVLWELGSSDSMLGGTQTTGLRSKIDISPIIACDGLSKMKSKTTFPLSNPALFVRDEFRCMYCGENFSYRNLTRDHIKPRVQGGADIWENVITSCTRCNSAKGGRTPEEAGMELLAIPFAPNLFEFMYLKNHRILADQMDFLSKKFSGKREWKLL